MQISADPAEGERDRYDRLLAYVDVEGTDFAQVMLTEGHARFYEGRWLDRQDTTTMRPGSRRTPTWASGRGVSEANRAGAG